MKTQAPEYILNFMFSGDYLDKNIGHEIINLYKSDSKEGKEGCHYIYLCQDGEFNEETHPNVQRIFFVRRTGNSGEMEILGYTDGKLEYIQPQYRDKEVIKDSKLKIVKEAFDAEEVSDITYGGVCIRDIFKNNLEQQNINVTFRAERVIRPKNPFYIQFENNGAYIKKIFSSSRNLRTYINSEEDKDAYNYLTDIINEITPNSEDSITSIQLESEQDKVTSTEIYGIQSYELAYSNALKFFIDHYREDFKKFFAQITQNNSLGEYVQTLREWKNIDLVIEYENAVIVIENKILSGLNGICKDKDFDYNQLDKYQNIILRTGEESPSEKEVNDKIRILNKKNQYFYVLTPNHNDIDLGERKEWHKIFYSQLYDFFEEKTLKGDYDAQFSDFLISIYNHTVEDYNYAIMRKRFVQAIANARMIMKKG